jgi:glycosyltransferase involved in cell wall biosynthesis
MCLRALYVSYKSLRAQQSLAVNTRKILDGCPYQCLLSGCGYFVFPSLAEGMPNVVLEAMSSDLPVVATRVPGSEELIHHGENGYLIAPSDFQALAQALITLINDRALRKRMGKQSKEFVPQYTWKSIAEQYSELYQQSVK